MINKRPMGQIAQLKVLVQELGEREEGGRYTICKRNLNY